MGISPINSNGQAEQSSAANGWNLGPPVLLGCLAVQPRDWEEIMTTHKGLLDPRFFGGYRTPLRDNFDAAIWDGALNANLHGSFEMVDNPTRWIILKIEIPNAIHKLFKDLTLITNIIDCLGRPKGVAVSFPMNVKEPADGFVCSIATAQSSKNCNVPSEEGRVHQYPDKWQEPHEDSPLGKVARAL